MEKKKTQKNTIITKIAVSTMIAIFSLASAFAGTYAWFSSMSSVSVSGANVMASVGGDGGSISGIDLIMFDYPIDRLTNEKNYLEPESGKVIRYSYVWGETNGFINETQRRDDYDAAVAAHEYSGTYDEWKETYVASKVDIVMNPYDPVEKIVKGNDFRLFDQNCSAIYAITLKVSSVGNYKLDVFSNWLEDRARAKDSNDILLSDCLDFDVYSTNPLDAVIGNDANGKPLYYPTYIIKDPETEQYPQLSADEEIFYRIAYLSEQLNSHPNFYSGSKLSPVPLATQVSTSFASADSELTVYINANYAPSQMDQYVNQIYESKIDAIYDFNFDFKFTKV